MTDDSLAQARLRSLYSGEAFAEAGEIWVKTLAGHLTQLAQRTPRVLNWDEPATNIKRAHQALEQEPLGPDASEWIGRFESLLQQALTHGQNLHHPRYIGHQVPASVPIAAFFDALGAVTNQVMAIYEMGPWATSVERAMIERLGQELGYPEGTFAGLVTSGGSLANLTALLTARNVVFARSWRQGLTDPRQVALVVQEDVHYCVSRSAGILGLGTEQIVRVPVDARRKMRVDALDQILTDLAAKGRQVMAVVAGACSTPIGAFDPLDEIADVCAAHQVWFHVDAAHGGGTLFSARHRSLCAGLERADSVVWDAHKMMFMPALCAFVLYKDKAHRYVTFEQDAPYLFDPSSPGMAEYDSGIQTVECTKRAATFPLWGMWSLFGKQLFADAVDVTLGTTKCFYGLLKEAEDFVPLHEPECNIQVFRYLPQVTRDWSEDQVGELQLAIRRWLITGGHSYIVPLKLEGVGALRATVMNPCTEASDLVALLEEIRRFDVAAWAENVSRSG